jgi:hypothetical protein
MKKTIINTILALTIPAALVLSSCSQSNLNTQLITPDNGISALSQPITRVQTSLPRGTRELGASMFSYIVMDDGLSQAGVMFLKALEMGANDKAYYSAFADLQGADNSFVFRIKPSKNENELESDAKYLSPTMKEVTSNDPKVILIPSLSLLIME